jgi:hypothetical protein
MVSLGETFYGGGEVHGADHLWIVINDPQAHNGTALIVNVTTLRPGADTTYVLRRGDHPFIQHDSYVRFSSAKEASSRDIELLIKAGHLRPHQSADTMLVERIRTAAQAAPQLPTGLKRLL